MSIDKQNYPWNRWRVIICRYTLSDALVPNNVGIVAFPKRGSQLIDPVPTAHEVCTFEVDLHAGSCFCMRLRNHAIGVFVSHAEDKFSVASPAPLFGNQAVIVNKKCVSRMKGKQILDNARPLSKLSPAIDKIPFNFQTLTCLNSFVNDLFFISDLKTCGQPTERPLWYSRYLDRWQKNRLCQVEF